MVKYKNNAQIFMQFQIIVVFFSNELLCLFLFLYSFIFYSLSLGLSSAIAQVCFFSISWLPCPTQSSTIDYSMLCHPPHSSELWDEGIIGHLQPAAGGCPCCCLGDYGANVAGDAVAGILGRASTVSIKGSLLRIVLGLLRGRHRADTTRG